MRAQFEDWQYDGKTKNMQLTDYVRWRLDAISTAGAVEIADSLARMGRDGLAALIDVLADKGLLDAADVQRITGCDHDKLRLIKNI